MLADISEPPSRALPQNFAAASWYWLECQLRQGDLKARGKRGEISKKPIY